VEGRDAGTPREDSGPPPEDSGPPPTDACTPSDEICNMADDDCDGMTDEGFELATDPDNCGGCGNVCELPHATAGCMGGACVVDSCEMGFDDCDDDPGNGCESELATDAGNCGGCGTSCIPPDRMCCDGTCAMMCR